jgi:DNA-binding protein HU-beta
MSKKILIDTIVANNEGMTNKDAERAIDAVLGGITKALQNGEKVSLVGFGNFEKKHKEAGTARNPSNGETIQVPAKNVPTFKAGKGLKDAMNA